MAFVDLKVDAKHHKNIRRSAAVGKNSSSHLLSLLAILSTLCFLVLFSPCQIQPTASPGRGGKWSRRGLPARAVPLVVKVFSTKVPSWALHEVSMSSKNPENGQQMWAMVTLSSELEFELRASNSTPEKDNCYRNNEKIAARVT